MSIILSQNLVLEAPASVPLNTPLIGYDNIVTAATLGASSEDGSFPASNMANPSTVEKWKASSAAAQTITITPATADAIDYVAIARHNMGTLQVPVTLSGRRTETDAYEAIAEVIAADDGPILFRFTAQSFSTLTIDIDLPADTPAIAVVFCGKLLVFEQGVLPSHTPLRFGRNSKVITGRAESGEYLGRIITGRGRQTVADMANLSPAWCRAELEPFLIYAEAAPFFYAWFHDTYPNEVGYNWLSNEPRPAINDHDHTMQVSLQMSGIA